MRSNRLTSEQSDSLADELTRQGVLHGDTVDVAIAVGVEPRAPGAPAHMAFCPSSVRVLGVVREGTKAEREAPHSPKVRFNAGRAINRTVDGRSGFLACRARITSNGQISVKVDPKSLVFQAPPTDDDGKRIRSNLSRPICQQLVAQLVG